MVCFSEFLTPSIFGDNDFFNFISFLMIFSATEALIGQVQVLFGHQKQWNPPSGFGLP